MPQRGNDNIHYGSKEEIKDLFPLRDFEKVAYRKYVLIYENLCVSYQAKFLSYSTHAHTHTGTGIHTHTCVCQHVQLVVNSILNNAVVTG